MRRKMLAVIVVTLAVALAACGGDKKPASSGSTDTAAADRAKAEKLVLVQADFPVGWAGTTAQPDTAEDDEQGAALAECAGAVDPAVAESATVTGKDFAKDTAEVSSEVTYVKTTEQAQTDLAAITGSKLESCVKDFAGDLLQKELEGSGATLERFDFDRIETDKVGDATEAFRMTATVSAGGQTLRIFIDLIFILKDRAEISLSFSEVGKPFDQALQKSLLAKMGAKLSAA
jgi:hypothetical protein